MLFFSTIYLQQIVQISEIIMNLTLAAGAVVGIYFGANELKTRIKVSNLRKRFPLERIGKDFKIIESSAMRGRLYILDLKEGKRFWIQNWSTFLDLGFLGHEKETIEHKKFMKYPESSSPTVLTRGDPGR